MQLYLLMLTDLVFTDKNDQQHSLSLDKIAYIGIWPGQMNVFYNDNTPTTIAILEDGDELSMLDIIAHEMKTADLKVAPLTMSGDNSSYNYKFLYNTDLVRSYSTEKPNKINQDRIAQDEIFSVDGQSFGIPFTPTDEEKKHFIEMVHASEKDWITLAPNQTAPMNTKSGEFSIRKSAIKSISGYLLGNIIFDLNDNTRIFVQVDENPHRTQHTAIAEQIETLKPLIGPQSRAFTNPDYFNPDDIILTIIDFSDAKESVLLMYEGWHLAYETLEDAKKAVDNFVRAYQDNPDYSLELPDKISSSEPN